jgi:hypothetical protein
LQKAACAKYDQCHLKCEIVPADEQQSERLQLSGIGLLGSIAQGHKYQSAQSTHKKQDGFHDPRGAIHGVVNRV